MAVKTTLPPAMSSSPWRSCPAAAVARLTVTGSMMVTAWTLAARKRVFGRTTAMTKVLRRPLRKRRMCSRRRAHNSPGRR